MTRTLVATIFTLLIALSSMAQSHRRGPGCWRTATAQAKAATRLAAARQTSPRKAEAATGYLGKKKGLVILAEFSDKKFKSANDREKYNHILNTHGYTSDEGFNGSVSDYFLDQSGGLFELDFDVVGPYTTKYSYAYYGKNDEDDLDQHPEEMVIEMCRAADADINFADYDWDGDGEVDEVFVVYAWKGEADSDIKNTIWPHMWSLDEAEKKLVLDGVKINIYACANELESDGTINGIGTFCHEFSHCLGFADLYDVTYSGSYGMGDFDLMAGGLYGKDGFCPVGYSAFEKMSCGWQQPIVLSNEDVAIEKLMPMNEQGEFYVIYNDAHPDEYYLIENRQKKGWDKYIPARGLMITHVDYDEEVWYNNIPNTVISKKKAFEQGYTCGNDHQRLTFFHANNNERSPKLYPYSQRDSLTATSTPAATLFNANSLGMKLMTGSILNIRQNTDGTMAFSYRAVNPVVTNILSPVSHYQTPDTHHPSPIYTIDGRVAGTSLENLRHGVYIVNGRKVTR